MRLYHNLIIKLNLLSKSMDYFIVVVTLNFSFLIRFTDLDFAIRNYKTWSDLIEFQYFNTSILERN